jgi:hypothetical protein
MRPQKNWLPFHPFGSRHLAASAFLLLTIPAAFAADDATCDAYAAFAISKEAQTAARACGYSGAPWSTNYVGHLNWCLATKDEHVHDQWNQRRDAIARCNRCVSYSINATYFAERARALACKFDFNHPQWSPNYADHFRWCAGANDESRQHEETGRANQVDRCAACTEYAKVAARISHRARQWSCQVSGPRWSTNENTHYSWCMGLEVSARATAIDLERLERSNAQALCELARVNQQTGTQSQALTRGTHDPATTRQKANPRLRLPGEAGTTKPRSPQSSVSRADPCIGVRGHPCGSSRSSSRSSSSSAMDRLGGSGSSMPDSAGAGAASRGPRPTAPASAGARSGSGASAPAAINSDGNIGSRPEQLR